MFMVGLTMKPGELKESTCAHVGYGSNLPCYDLLRWMSRTSFMGDHVQVRNRGNIVSCVGLNHECG